MKLRLLHLEDNREDVELVRTTLARDGIDCEVLAVDTGAAYRAALQQSHFDLVLSDSSVPGYNGSEALFDARERFPGIPFIVVSGASDQQSAGTGAVTARVPKAELHCLAPTIRQVLPAAPAAEICARLERKLAERTAAVDRLNTEIEVLNKEFEAFSYSVAHDLRSPLITIDGFAQVLHENLAKTLDDTNREHLERISAAVRRMHRLINDLIGLSRIVRAPIRIDTVDLSRLAREILQAMRARAPTRAAEFIVAEGLCVQGDPGLLRFVLENLLSNAWKFTVHKEITRIEFESGTSRAGRPIYHVRDNGAGFDPRYAAKLFNPFQRLHPETQFPGTGIGLATVQRIIHRHAGEIWAESAPDCGATFYFTLPG